MIGKLVTGNLGKGTMWIALSGEKIVKVFVSYMTIHRTVTSAEEVLIIKWKEDPFMDVSQPLSPATPVITEKSHEENGHDGRDRDYAWTQQYGFLLMADLATVTAEYLSCQLQSPTLSPCMAPFPSMMNWLPGGKMITLDCFPYGRGSIFFLLEQILILDMELSSCMQYFCQNHNL